MTTYTITGIKLSSYVNDLPTVITPTELKVVFADGESDLSYKVIDLRSGTFPEIDMTGTNPYYATFDGVRSDQIFNGVFDGTFAGFMTWSAGTAYLLDFYSGTQGADYVFQMGGTPLPTMNTAADASAFYQSITGIGPITSGPYAPGQAIPLTGFQNVQITENDVIFGDNLANNFAAGAGNDEVHGGLGNDTLSGNQGADKLYGQGGADKLVGGIGNDKLFGGVGADVLNGGLGRDKLFGGNFHDRLFGNGGNDALFGNGGNDKMYGGFGNDRLFGGLGNDRMFGGGGNDRLTGSKGDDFMRGGAGADTFIFDGAAIEGANTIGDFTVGTDMIRIGGGITFSDIVMSEGGAGTTVSWGLTSVLLMGVNVADLTVDSFDFV